MGYVPSSHSAVGMSLLDGVPESKYWYKVEMMRALHARGFDNCGQEWVRWCGFIGEQIEVSRTI